MRSEPLTSPLVPTLGESLERQRLEHRLRRVKHALIALEERTTLRTDGDRMPAPLVGAVREFSAELSRLDQRLAELGRHRH
jgi:hypothetical protein